MGRLGWGLVLAALVGLALFLAHGGRDDAPLDVTAVAEDRAPVAREEARRLAPAEVDTPRAASTSKVRRDDPVPEPPEVLVAAARRVERLATLAGSVLDLAGRPVTGEVRLHFETEGGTNFAVLARDGSYREDGLPPGDVVRRVWSGAWRQGDGRPEDVPLHAGETSFLDVYVRAGVRVVGTVVDADRGLPIEGALVTTRTLTNEAANSVTTGAGGRFEFTDVLVETFVDENEFEWAMVTLGAEAEGYSTPVTTRYLAARTPEERYEFELALRPTNAALVGRVVSPEGDGVAAARVVLVDADARSDNDLTDEDGSFRFDGLPTGEVRVAAWHWSASKGLRYGSDAVELGIEEARLELELADASDTTLRGRVVAPGDLTVALEAIAVRVMPFVEHRGLQVELAGFSTTGLTAADGTFEVSGVLPGRSRVALELGRRARDERLRVFPETHVIDVAAGEAAGDIEFRLLPGFWVTGVVEATELELARLLVAVETEEGTREAETRPSADGRFELGPFEPQALTVLLLEGASRLDTRRVGPEPAGELDFRYE